MILVIDPDSQVAPYEQLRGQVRAAVIQTRGRNGSVVAECAGRNPSQDPALDAAQAYAHRMRELGLAPADALALVRTALRFPGAPGGSRAG